MTSSSSTSHARTAEALRFATSYHTPVMAREVVEYLITDTEGIYVDGTLGGGGHAAALLDTLGPGALVVGIDRDREAVAAATERLSNAVETGRFRALQGNFADMKGLLRDVGIHGVTGVLLDLGVSSHQIDQAERGFAFSTDGPLDMRMDTSVTETAADLVARLDASDLADVIYEFGDERKSRRIARAVKDVAPTTTGALAEAVRSAVSARDEVKSLARVFQALRIAVNGEVEALEHGLEAALEVLVSGGRLAVISYHSLEDRRAKRFLRHGHFGRTPKKDFFGNVVTPWSPVVRSAVTASEREVEANPRARSARLRVSEKHLHTTPWNHTAPSSASDSPDSIRRPPDER